MQDTRNKCYTITWHVSKHTRHVTKHAGLHQVNIGSRSSHMAMSGTSPSRARRRTEELVSTYLSKKIPHAAQTPSRINTTTACECGARRVSLSACIHAPSTIARYELTHAGEEGAHRLDDVLPAACDGARRVPVRSAGDGQTSAVDRQH